MKYVFSATFVFLLGSCKEEGKSLLFKKVDSLCSKESANYAVKLDTILPSKWTRMFFFEYSCSLEFIENKLGIKYEHFEEFSDKIVFLYNDRIVYREESKVKFSGVDVNGGGLPYNFPYNSSEKYFEIDSGNSVFRVSKIRDGNTMKFYFYKSGR